MYTCNNCGDLPVITVEAPAASILPTATASILHYLFHSFQLLLNFFQNHTHLPSVLLWNQIQNQRNVASLQHTYAYRQLTVLNRDTQKTEKPIHKHIYSYKKTQTLHRQRFHSTKQTDSANDKGGACRQTNSNRYVGADPSLLDRYWSGSPKKANISSIFIKILNCFSINVIYGLFQKSSHSIFLLFFKINYLNMLKFKF